MKNEEAIKILGQYDVSNIHFYTTDGEEIPFTEWSDALELAITALGAIDQYRWERDIAIEQLKELGYGLGEKIRTDTDCVSRQAAIDVIFSEPLYKTGMKKRSAEEVVPAIFEKVKVLPSTQPEPCEDAVSRQAVINIINKPVIIKAKEQIEALPSVQPEQNYCKDCRKHNRDFGYKEEICPLVRFRGKAQGHEFDYQYCVYFERRER